jgi:hypothetical protein
MYISHILNVTYYKCMYTVSQTTLTAPRPTDTRELQISTMLSLYVPFTPSRSSSHLSRSGRRKTHVLQVLLRRTAPPLLIHQVRARDHDLHRHGDEQERRHAGASATYNYWHER